MADKPAVKEARKRPAKPGMVRVVVQLTQEHNDRLVALAKSESAVFPRPVGEYLSVLVNQRFESHLTAGLEPSKQTELPLK